MTLALDKLGNILKLEEEQGFQDKVVMGGLGGFADAWREQARSEVNDEAWLVRIAEQMKTYSHLTSPDERQASLAALRVDLETGPGPEHPSGDQPRGQIATTTGPPAPKPSRQVPERRTPQRRHKRTEKSPLKPEDIDLTSPVTVLSGIGPTQGKRLARLGLHEIKEMLHYYPRRYDDFRTLKTINQLEYGEEVTIMGQIRAISSRRTRSGKFLTKATIEDGSGTIEATWFNRPYLEKQLKPLRQVVLSGRVDEYLGRLTFSSPQWEPLDRHLLHTARLVPVYPLTEGVSARWLRRLMKRTVDYWSHRVPDHLPAEVRRRVSLLDLERALRQIHFPDDWDSLEKARYRLAFDELFLIQIGVLRQRHRWQSAPGKAVAVDDDILQRFILGLPFALTSAQQRALGDIIHDLRRDQPMSRLLQGDVGSGKTVVAVAAMALTGTAGSQTALMAPTEILAEQHFRTVSRLLGSMEAVNNSGGTIPLNAALLTGSTPSSEKEAIYQGLAQGDIDVVVGTHALIQEGVQFRRLALAIVDEQHRFGVAQRAALRQKGYHPHVLVMTATPIPRSLALTIYGDLDLSIIDEMPPGRKPVETHVLEPTERERAYSFVRGQVKGGRQAFVICPLVEESEKLEAKAAIDEHKRLKKQVFPNLRLGLLHGRMKGEEKETVMAQFMRGQLDILVSTSVVEVGIDVPNASVMLVEGADRFGLAQLHQFRGRVGRGEHRSLCLLIGGAGTEQSKKRLQAIESTHDGFVLAEKDLELRGPGEFFGTRQSGLPDLRLASTADMRLLEVARSEGQRLFDADPELASPDVRLLVQKVNEFWSSNGDVS
jgi:ATP-dependent DNA helicase RecG